MPIDQKTKKNLEIPVSFFHNIYDNGFRDGAPNFAFNGIKRYGEFALVLRQYSTTNFATKESAPLFCPTEFTGPRGLLNTTIAGILVVDNDGVLNIRAVVDLFASDGIECIAYTTASNQHGERFRVIVPIAATIRSEGYRPAVDALVDYIDTIAPGWKTAKNEEGKYALDPSKLSPESMFYVPGLYKTAGTNEFHYIDGAILAAKDWVTAFPQPEPRPAPIPGAAPRPIIYPAADDDERHAKCLAAVAVISPDIERDRWLNVGKVLKDELGEGEGFNVWDSWSRGSHKYKPREMANVWRSFNRPYVVKIATLFKYADDSDPSWRKPFIKVIDRYGHLISYESAKEMQAELLGKQEEDL